MLTRGVPAAANSLASLCLTWQHCTQCLHVKGDAVLQKPVPDLVFCWGVSGKHVTPALVERLCPDLAADSSVASSDDRWRACSASLLASSSHFFTSSSFLSSPCSHSSQFRDVWGVCCTKGAPCGLHANKSVALQSHHTLLRVHSCTCRFDEW